MAENYAELRYFTDKIMRNEKLSEKLQTNHAKIRNCL